MQNQFEWKLRPPAAPDNVNLQRLMRGENGNLPHLPPPSQARLEGALRSLRGALLGARTLERRNAQLAASGLDSVEEMLRALQSVTPGTRYRADARLAPPASVDRVDRRA